MDNIFKHLRRYSKQYLSLLLAFVVFVENPLSAYASTALPVVVSGNESKDFYLESPDPDFNPKTYDGVPFYFDEDGNKIYDEENIYKDYVKPEYLSIAHTFEEYPLTTIDYSKSDISTYVVGVDDAALAVLAVTLATYGIYIGHEAIKDFASTHFEPWVRTKYGNDASVMENMQSWLAVKAGTAFAGMKLFSDVVGKFVKSGQVKDSTFAISSQPTFSKNTYTPLTMPSSGSYITSYEYPLSNNNVERGYLYYGNDISNGYSLGALYTSDFDRFDAVFVNSKSGIYYVNIKRTYINYSKTEDYYYGSSSTIDYFDYNGRSYLPLIEYLNVPIFKNKTAITSYFKYGTSGGVVDLPEYTLTPDTSIPLKKTWSGLLSNSSAYTKSNTMTLPDSSSAIDNLLQKIYASDTEEEVIENVNSVWKVQKEVSKPTLSAEQAYSHLSYVLAAIAASAGVSVTAENINEFIGSFYGGYVDGTSARKEEQAEEITEKFVVIEGGGNNGDPDNDDKDKNKYKLAKKLATAFSSFLLSVGITQDLLDFEANPNVAANIKVDGVSAVEPDPSPDPDPDPDPSPSPGTDTNTSAGTLKNIANAIELLPDKLISGFASSVEKIGNAIELLPDKLVSGFASSIEKVSNAIELLPDKSLVSRLASTVTDMARTIELLPNKLVLGFASSFSDLGTLVGSLPNAIAELLPGVLASSLPNILADTFGLVNGFSFPAALSSIEAALGALPDALTNPLAAIQEALSTLSDTLIAPLSEIKKNLADLPDSLADSLKKDESVEPPETNDGSGLFSAFLDILMLLILIVIALLILFMNCLILIFNMYQIPASTDLFNDDVLKGLEFLKSINIPFPGTNGIGLFELLMCCVYFVLFASVIASLRKKIEKIHV